MHDAVKMRVAAGLTLASGVLFVVVPLLVEFVAGDFFLLMPLAFVLLLAAMPGLRRVQQYRDDKHGQWGLRLTLLGVVGLLVATTLGEVVAEVGPAAEAAVIVIAALCGLAIVAGLVLFGFGMLKAGLLPAVGIWLFLGGVVFAMGTEIAEQFLSGTVPWVMDVAPPLGFVIAGLGLLSVGRAAWSREATSALGPH